ncbi:MAG: LCP family protein, partial [Romboutsia sp.]|uniref:LCP family protein n=1 Tax=Romboutsia sp. TaxID=1965302 RepID=UPI003F3E20B2
MNTKILKRILITLVVLVILIPACAFGYMYFKLGGIYDKEGDESILGTNDYKAEKGIINILLCGTDARPGETSSRTDSMMILTIDNNNKNLKLTSLARDTYVSTSDYGDIKLTEANAYGGINLLVESIEKNFELDIQDYIIVDFYSFMDIVDTLG